MRIAGTKIDPRKLDVRKLDPRKFDRRQMRKQALRAVAIFELVKGIFVLLMGICALLMVRKDAWLLAESLLAKLHINTDRHFAQVFLDFADDITDAHLWAAARIAFAYSLLRFTEAYGLWRERAWAEWVALVSGTLLVPLEIRELLRGVTLVRASLFLGNIAIILWMLYLIRENYRHRKAEAAEAQAAAAEANRSKTQA